MTQRNFQKTVFPAMPLVLLLLFFISCGSPVKSEQVLPSNATTIENSSVKKARSFPFYVYKDGYSKLNHFFPSGWMGDFDDMSYNDAWPVNPKSGKTCFRIRYSAKGSRGFGWAGIYWQDPINNWNVGALQGGYDLTGAKKLKFYARGQNGGEMVEFQVGGMTTETRTSGVLSLNRQWLPYEIDLEGMDLSVVNGGFNAIYNRGNNPDGCVFYLDDIVYTDRN